MRVNSSINRVLEDFDKLFQKKSVIIVCNTKMTDDSNADKSRLFNPATEYLSDVELEQVIAMFSSCCSNLEIFTHEFEFFEYILKNNSIDRANTIVYNSAQSGSGAGRKSLIPAFCNLEKIICTGSNPYVVGLCRHKYHVNKLLESTNLSIPKSWLFNHDWLLAEHPDNEQKVIIKPIYESASIGIDSDSVFYYSVNSDRIIEAKNIEMNQPIIVQEFIPGYEVELPLLCMSEVVMPFIPIGLSLSVKDKKIDNAILDYHRIYFDHYNFFDFTEVAIFNPQIIETATKAAKVLGMSGLCRVDFRIDVQGNYYITDVSTNPHFISHSSVNYAAHLMGLSDSDIIKCILLAAVSNHEV